MELVFPKSECLLADNDATKFKLFIYRPIVYIPYSYTYSHYITNKSKRGNFMILSRTISMLMLLRKRSVSPHKDIFVGILFEIELFAQL